MKRTSLYLHLLFGLIVAVELAGRILDLIVMEYPVKPLIMVWISVYFLVFRNKKEFTAPVLFAFFFSWLGDILLMFSHRSDLFFFAGVGGFFLAQLTYIHLFLRYSERGGKGYLQRKPVLGLLFVAYAAGIYTLLLPGLTGIMKPVILLYALSLITMSMAALNRRGRVQQASFLPVFTGSVLFVISDSMIALNRFHGEFPLAGFWIMVTYIAAQYLIMRGLIVEQPAGGKP